MSGDPSPGTVATIKPGIGGAVETGICPADVARRLHIEPRIAMMSSSSLCGVGHEAVGPVRRAAAIARRERPEPVIAGEVRLDDAAEPELPTRGGTNDPVIRVPPERRHPAGLQRDIDAR